MLPMDDQNELGRFLVIVCKVGTKNQQEENHTVYKLESKNHFRAPVCHREGGLWTEPVWKLYNTKWAVVFQSQSVSLAVASP